MLERLHKPVVCIVGPTATGKSDLGIEVARALSGEVVSADSMQVYRGMDIGTAKLMPEEMKGVRHHMLDVVGPDEPFTVASWADGARHAIDRMHTEGRLPVVVGGTGLYIRAITEDLDFASQAGSNEVRERWQAYLDTHGSQRLHEQLAALDPASAARLHPNDIRRVIRALELTELRGEPMSRDYDWSIKGGRYEPILLGLYLPREVLYDRVRRRVDRMCELGLRDEVAGLLEKGYHRSLTSMQAIGYKEMAAALDGELSYEDAVESIKRATTRFVKRQLSWFMRDPRIVWIPMHADGTLPPLDGVLRTIVSVSEGFPIRQGE